MWDDRDYYYWQQQMGREDARTEAHFEEMGVPCKPGYLNTKTWPGLKGSGAYQQGKHDEFLRISTDPLERARKREEESRRFLFHPRKVGSDDED